MDTAGLSGRVHYEVISNDRVVDWKTKVLSQETITNTLLKFIDIYNDRLKNTVCASGARPRAELHNICSGYRCTYDLNQRQMYLHHPDGVTLLTQKDWRWDTAMMRVWKLCPSKWHRDSVDNMRHPLDILTDMDLCSDQITERSQHGDWCMDILYTESAKRTGLMKKGNQYCATSNEAYSRSGDVLLTTSQKTIFEWVGAHGEQGRIPSANKRGMCSLARRLH